jgi:hypothetical protein
MSSVSGAALSRDVEGFKDTSRKMDVRLSNMQAAKAVSDAVRTSLGPRRAPPRCTLPSLFAAAALPCCCAALR